MIKILSCLILSVGVFCIGWYANDIKNESSSQSAGTSVSLSHLMPYASTKIPNSKLQNCQNIQGNTVGSVIASIIDMGMTMKQNRIYSYCQDEQCRFGVTDCTKYKDSECGSRNLEFRYRNGKVEPHSFECVDYP